MVDDGEVRALLRVRASLGAREIPKAEGEEGWIKKMMTSLLVWGRALAVLVLVEDNKSVQSGHLQNGFAMCHLSRSRFCAGAHEGTVGF